MNNLELKIKKLFTTFLISHYLDNNFYYDVTFSHIMYNHYYYYNDIIYCHAPNSGHVTDVESHYTMTSYKPNTKIMQDFIQFETDKL